MPRMLNFNELLDMWSLKNMRYAFFVLGILFLTLLFFIFLTGSNAYVGRVLENSHSMEEILKAHYYWYSVVAVAIRITYGLVVISDVWFCYCMYRDYKKMKIPFFPRVFRDTIPLIVVTLALHTFISLNFSNDAQKLAEGFHEDYLEIRNNTLNKAEGSIYMLENGVSLRKLGKDAAIGAFFSCRIGKNGKKLLAPNFFLEKYSYRERIAPRYLEDGRKFEVYYTSRNKIIVGLK